MEDTAASSTLQIIDITTTTLRYNTTIHMSVQRLTAVLQVLPAMAAVGIATSVIEADVNHGSVHFNGRTPRDPTMYYAVCPTTTKWR